MKNIIYGLKDPRNDVYQYIGKSTVGNKRPLKHLTQSSSPKVVEWIKELENLWLYPIIEVIEEVNDLNDLADREKHWIIYYADINPNLLNIHFVNSDIVEKRSEQDEKDFDELFRIIANISSIVKKERQCRRLTQQELAEKMNVSRSTLVLLEKGRNVNLSVVIKCLLALKAESIKTKIIGNQRIRK